MKYNKINSIEKNTELKKAVQDLKKATQEYSYYSRVLNEPFETIEELREAEEAYYAKLKAKEDAAASKKADAKKVEDAFKALNAARKTYKDDLTVLTKQYSEDLVNLKNCFEKYRDEIKATLAEAEEAYSTALKNFTEKYPEGYHLTLKDGDFETTISGARKTAAKPTGNFLDLFDLFFNF
jgi:chromosome segregation ATPase